MAAMRVVFMGTPDFAVPCLESLICKGHEIVAVITQPDRPKGRGHKLMPSPVKELAVKYNLLVLQPEKINDQQFLDKLTVLAPDIIVVVAFGQLLRKAILELPIHGCINVHASILPYYRGAAPIHWAVINGEKTTGVTIMLMKQGMDTGDIVLKKQLSISENETTGELHDRLRLLGSELLAAAMELAKAGRLPREPQDNSIATYASKLNRELEQINWNFSAQKIHNLVRGLNPWPGAYTLHNSKQLKVLKTQVFMDGANYQPGAITAITEQGFVVGTAQGQLEVYEVQPESKKKMTAREYAQGYLLRVGQRLE